MMRYARSFKRFQSAIPKVEANGSWPSPPRSSFRDSFKSPTTKSIVLVIILTSVVTHMMERRKSLQYLKENHQTKMTLLKDVLVKLQNGEKVDLQQELTILSRIHSVKETEIDFDQQLNDFLRLADESDHDQPTDTTITEHKPNNTYL